MEKDQQDTVVYPHPFEEFRVTQSMPRWIASRPSNGTKFVNVLLGI